MRALLTMDGSDTSLSILSTAKRLCELIPDIELHMLTVLDPKAIHGTPATSVSDPKGAASGTLVVTSPAPRVIESHGEAGERLHRQTEAEMARLKTLEFPDANVFYHVGWSAHAADAIVAQADELDADVIVMATHGRSGLSHLMAGSVAESVIRRSNRPVLVRCPDLRAS